MELSEIRTRINDIDDRMRILFDERIECSGQVAMVKLENNDEVFKPLREREIAERLKGEGEAWYLAYVRKVIQLSRKYQYKQFIDNGKQSEDFLKLVSESAQREVFKQGGTLCITMKADPTAENALNMGDIVSIISDTKLTLMELKADGADNTVRVKLGVADNDAAKREAYMLSYMLYKETLTFAL